MSRQLPELIEPLRLAEKQRSLKGEISLSRMKRLAESLSDPSGVVSVDLCFDRDAAGWSTVTGSIATDLTLQCQRCMQNMSYPLNIEVNLGIAAPDQMSLLPEQYEPFLLEEELVSLAVMVEDELILELPVVPMHEPSDCSVRVPEKAEEDNTSGPVNKGNAANSGSKSDTGRENPFLVLEELKTKLRQTKE